MPERVIVIGASAGGVSALSKLVRELPSELPASILIALHLSPDFPSQLDQILTKAGPLPAIQAQDGEELHEGQVYLPTPGRHLLIEDGLVRVTRGPKENGARPSIDTLFRSAAQWYGPQVIGVIMTGTLYDGTAGMLTIKRRGGMTVVQDPREAEYPDMPSAVLRYVNVDHTLPLKEIARLLVRLCQAPVVAEDSIIPPDQIAIESQIAGQQLTALERIEAIEQIGKRSTYSCPDCQGPLWEIDDGRFLRFRCHTGHALSADSLQMKQSEKLEEALWSAIRSLEEKIVLSEQVAARTHYYNRPSAEVARHHEEARRLGAQVSLLRELVHNGLK